MTATIHRTGSTVDAIDMFCGFGGSSQGIHAAGATVRVAANHNQHAIDVHAANFPDTDHHIADMVDPDAKSYVDPADLPPARFVWASPSCRHHSQANATKLYKAERARTLLDLIAEAEGDDLYAKSERSRVTMSCPLRYAARRLPELVVIENVVEAAHWGPNRDGSTFAWWLAEWGALGYRWDAKFLNSMFFGAPQSRDRMYLVMWKTGNRAPDLDHQLPIECECGGDTARQAWRPKKPTWPTVLETWGKYGKQYDYRCTRCDSIVEPATPGAWQAIDWSDLGPTLGDRAKPLAPKTIDRIRRGLEKFKDYPAVVIPAAGNTHERPGQTRARHIGQPLYTQTGTMEHGFASLPFLVEMRGGGSVKAGQHPVTQPMHAVTAGGLHHGLVASGFTKVNGGPTDTTWHPMSDRLNTITGRDTTALASITLPLTHQGGDRARHVTGPLDTITGSRERYVASKTADVDLDSVHFRMLKPDPELRRAMAFDDDYHVFGTQAQMTAGLGNAVTPPVAAWLTQRALATLA